jgi:predicted trehalose synthase
MLLVERLTGMVAQSYATDAALLAELRAAWPPGAAPTGNDAPDGYRPTDLAALEPAGAVRLTDRLAVALAATNDAADDSFTVVPVVRADPGYWRRAVAGDGLSAFVAGAPMASERPIGVDQTHVSVVVGERAVVKWFRRVRPGPSRAATLLAHLAAVGPVDDRLLAAFEIEQECRELIYAARFLPRWTYAPMATLRARFGGG